MSPPARRFPTPSATLRGFGLALAMVFGLLAASGEAEAQYLNQQLGFEAGYTYVESGSFLTEHAPTFGLRAGYKATDHWWYTARALISFRGDTFPADRTVLLFDVTPVDFRYYFLTDEFRPFLGAASVFHIVANSDVPSPVHWGIGPVAGVEFKLRRNLFLGLQVDAQYFLAFDSENYLGVNSTLQLLFFL